MDRTEAATQIITAMIQEGAFHLKNHGEDEQKVERVTNAFQKVYETIKACERNRE